MPPRDSTYDSGGAEPPGIDMVSRSQCSIPLQSKYELVDNLTVYPPELVIIAHSVTPECFNLQDCCQRVASIHAYNVNDLGDLGHQFYVGSDGRVYEGRKWYQYGAHTYGYNCKSYGVSLMGNFMTQTPVERQVQAVSNLIHQLVENGLLSANYTIYAHKDIIVTESPGKKLFSLMDIWPHRADPHKPLPAKCT